MRFFYLKVGPLDAAPLSGSAGPAVHNPQGFQIKNKNGQLEIYRKNGEPITKFKTREEYHLAKQFLATQPKSDAFIKLSNKLDGYNANEGLRKSVLIDPNNKQQVIVFGKKYQIPASGLDMHNLMDTVRGQAGLPEKDFNKLLEDKYGLKETTQTKGNSKAGANIDIGDGYSFKLIPPTLLKDGKPIKEIKSPEDYKKIKEVLNKYYAQSSTFTGAFAAQFINHADNLYASQVKESKGNIYIFGVKQPKTEIPPDIKEIRKSLMLGLSAKEAFQSGVEASQKGTSIRLEDSQKGDINKDGKYEVGEQIHFYHQGEKLEGLIYEVKEENGKKTYMVAAGQKNVFKVTADVVKGKDDLKNAKVESLGSKWFIGISGALREAEHARAVLKAERALDGKDPYGLSQYGKQGMRTEDKMAGFQRVMTQLEQDAVNFCSSEKSAPEKVSAYLDRMKEALKSAGFDDKEIALIMTRVLKEAKQNLDQRIGALHTMRSGSPEYANKMIDHHTRQLNDLTAFAKKNSLDLKAPSIPWKEIGKMIIKPFDNLEMDKDVTAKWLTNKDGSGRSQWDIEKQNISKKDAVPGTQTLAAASRSLVAKYGSSGLPIKGLKNIKLKETRILASQKQPEGKPQVIADYVITGYSSEKKKFVVIEPATGKVFEGETEDKAMQAYCQGVSLDAHSKISYRDSSGTVREHIVEYSIGQRYVDLQYRLAVAAVIIGTVAATMGAGTPFIIAATAGGVTMAVIDTGELVVKASNGQQVTWKDWTMAGVDVLFSILLPGLSKMGKFAKIQFLAKNNLIDKATAVSLKKLSKTNPAEYEKELARVMREAYEKKPQAFMDAVKVTSKEIANPYRKGELQVEKVYIQGADGKLTQVKSRYTRLTQEEALKKYGKAMEKDKNLVISGEDFVLANQDRFKGQAVFHIHPKITVKPQYAQGTFTGEKDISEALGKMGVSYEDVVGAATSDNKVRIICQVEGKGYVAITAEIEFTADGKKVLKSMTAGHVAFNESLGNTDTLKNKNRAVTYRELQQYTERLEGYRATYMEARTKMNAVLKNAKDKLKVLSEEYAPKLSFNQANALERNKLRNELIQKRNQIINEAQTEIDLINNKVALNFTQVVVPAVGENKALYQKIDNTNRALKDMMNRLEPLQRSVAQTSSLAVIDQAVVSVKRDIHYLAELLNDVRAMKTQTTDPVMLRYLEYQEQSIQGMFKMSAGMLIGFTNRHHDLAEFNRLYSFLNDKAKAVFITWEKDFLAKNDQLNVVPLEYRIKAVKNLLAEMNS